MANRKRAEARRKAQAKASGVGGGKTGLWLTIAGLLVVIVGGIVWATSGDDDSADGANGSPTETTDGISSIPVSQPVTVTGDPLTGYDASQPVDLMVGMPAPLLNGLDFQGDEVVVDPAANGPYMVVFLAHWCPHCNAEVPRLLAWKGSGSVPAELNVIGVATAVSASAPNYPPAEWFSSKGWSWPVLVDEAGADGQAGKAAVAYGATGWPYFVIVGADGLVKVRASGELEVAELQQIVDDALLG